MCSKCGGLIGEPNKAYGWAGKWCHCAYRPSMNEAPQPSEMDRLREEVRRLNDRLERLEQGRAWTPTLWGLQVGSGGRVSK